MFKKMFNNEIKHFQQNPRGGWRLSGEPCPHTPVYTCLIRNNALYIAH